jgi:hypothetical protein
MASINAASSPSKQVVGLTIYWLSVLRTILLHHLQTNR